MEKLTKKIWNVKIKDYSIKNEFSLRKNLERLERWFEPDINYAINHEREHYNKSKELGYSSKYGIRIIRRVLFGINLPPKISSFVKPEKNISSKDQIKIALAPISPSSEDYALAQKKGYCSGIPLRGLI